MTEISLRPLAALGASNSKLRRAPVFAALAAGLALGSPATAQDTADAATPPPPSGRPGELAVDPEAAERALERTLVQTGRLLLPTGQFEIEPSLSYEYADDDLGFFPFVNVNGDVVAERVRVRSDRVTGALDLRVGLPFDSQVEMRLPVVYLDQQVDRPVSGISESDSTTGFGDFRLGLAKTLARESGNVPDIVGRITWDSGTGEEDDVLDLTTGFDEFSASLSLLRRLDPLAVTGAVAYEVALEKDDIRPGDVFGFSFGVVLAASPTTSLSLGFDAAFRQESEIDGDRIEGSDENLAFLTFGVASIVGRNTLLSLNFGAGLTEESTDYFVSASLPIRFNLR